MSRAALARTRVGAQPSSVHVPPGRSRSTSATRDPSSAARNAAVTPAGPPPMTARSKGESLSEFIGPSYGELGHHRGMPRGPLFLVGGNEFLPGNEPHDFRFVEAAAG